MPVTGPLGSATVAGPLPLRLAASPAMPLPVSGARAVIMMALRAFNLSLPTRARARAREALRGPGVRGRDRKSAGLAGNLNLKWRVRIYD